MAAAFGWRGTELEERNKMAEPAINQDHGIYEGETCNRDGCAGGWIWQIVNT